MIYSAGQGSQLSSCSVIHPEKHSDVFVIEAVEASSAEASALLITVEKWVLRETSSCATE